MDVQLGLSSVGRVRMSHRLGAAWFRVQGPSSAAGCCFFTYFGIMVALGFVPVATAQRASAELQVCVSSQQCGSAAPAALVWGAVSFPKSILG